MWLVSFEILHNCLKLWHERRSKMAVHKQGPTSSGHILVDTVFSFLILTSSKGNSIKLLRHVHLISESHKVSDRVRSRRKHEDERSQEVRVFVGLRNTESRRLDKLFTDLLGDEVLDGEWHLIRSDTLDDNHLLEIIKLVEIAWHGQVLRFIRVEDLLELSMLLNKCFFDTFE